MGGGGIDVRFEGFVDEDTGRIRSSVQRKLEVRDDRQTVYRGVLLHRDACHHISSWERVSKRFKQHHFTPCDLDKLRVRRCKCDDNKLRRVDIYDVERQYAFVSSNECNLKVIHKLHNFRFRSWDNLTPERGCLAC